jgi:hypothetical protein
MKAVGLINDYTKSDLFLKGIEQFKPDKKEHIVYQEYFKVYQSLYEKLKDSFEMITAINRKLV